MAMVKSGWLHRQSEYQYMPTTQQSIIPVCDILMVRVLWRPVYNGVACLLCQVPYYAGGKETGLTYGLTDVSSSTTISIDVTWKTTFTWGSTALTSAALLHVRVTHPFMLMSRPHMFPVPRCFCFNCVTFLFVLPYFLLELNPPEGKKRDALLQIVCRDGRVISLCADSADDAL